MGQPRAAAQRKLGFTARLYYMFFGIIALIWFAAYSFSSIMGVIDGITSFDVSNLSGRIDLQTFLLTFAGLCAVWFALTGTKYSIIKVPRVLPKLEGLAVVLLSGYFLCRTDMQGIADFFSKEDMPIIFLILIPIWAAMILGKISEWLGNPLKKVPSMLWHLILPVLIILTPFGDLTSNMSTAGDGFLVVGVPFLIFALPVYYRLGLDSDSMMLTVAAMGGGKSLYAAWNTLLSWQGGAFVLDPKGEHAQRTIDVRGEINAAHVLDPWGEVKHLYDGELGATFNPLEEIDIHSPNAKDDIFQIVESCIMQEADENANSKHFRENAQKIMTGVIAHVLSEYRV